MTRYIKEINTAEKALRRMGAGGDEVKRTLDDLSGKSVKELRRSLKSLQNTLESGGVARNSSEWNTLTEAIRRTRQEIEKVKTEQKVAADMGKGLSDWGSRWVGLVTVVNSALTSLSGVRRVADEAVQAYADMAEAQSQVTKYTGLTADEVRTLNEDFKRMNTRTSREQLNALAGDAGRLGINELAQSSSAAEGYIVEFSGRLASAARLNVKKFTQLVRTDANAALMEFAAAVGKMIGGN